MTFTLDGRDNLTRVLNNAGDSAARLHRRIDDSMTGSNASVRQFTQDANGRLRDLRGRFLSAGEAARLLGDDANGLSPMLRRVGSSAGSASAELGSAGGGLSGVLGAIAAIVVLTLLPAIGALVPMMAGLGVAAGTLALGFKGVGEAAALAGEDKKKYAAALKKLSPEAREFTKALVGLKGQFTAFAPQIQKAMLPGFTQALKDSKPVVDILGKAMTEMGRRFGNAARGVGRLMKDSGFQKDFNSTLKLGNTFVQDMTRSMGPFVRSLFSFGAASGPTLKAFSTGISGLLGKGLPGMFEGLKSGIGGSAAFLNGFFTSLNTLLPAIGRFSGAVAKTFGPVFGESMKLMGSLTSNVLDALGKALTFLSPVFKDVMFAVKSVNQVLAIIKPTIEGVASAIFGALLPSAGEVDKMRGPFQRLSEAIERNKQGIQEASRIFGGVVIDMTGIALENLPRVIALFRIMSTGVLNALGVILWGASKSFGWIPGIGDKLRTAEREFGQFKDSYVQGLLTAEQKTREFAQSAAPKLQAGKLKLNIDNWTSQIATAKSKMAGLPPERQAKLRANIADLHEKILQARRELDQLNGKTSTTYVQTVFRTAHGTVGHPKGSGGRERARGGPVFGPGTSTSDSIPLWASDGEYVVKASSVSKYGLAFMDALNAGRVGATPGSSGAPTAMAGAPSLPAMGGQTTGLGQDAARGLVAGMLKSRGAVDQAAQHMAAGIPQGIRTELQIASPSKKAIALMQDLRAGVVKGLTGSKAAIAATAKDLAKDIWKAWEGTRSTKDTTLVRMVDRDTKRLQSLASQRDALAARIAEANKYRGELTSAAREQSGLSSLGLDAEQVSGSSIQSGLSQKLARVKQFASYIQVLGKRGLSKSLLRQILAMGPESGYAYASALAGMSMSGLSSINRTQTDLDKATDALGAAGADVMYDAGKNAGRGFLTGLASQQKAIEQQMVAIARGMERAIKKALGIRSPSRVGHGVGHNFGGSIAGGTLASLPMVGRAVDAVGARMSALQPAAPRALAAAGGVSGGRGGMTVNVTIQGAIDPIATAEQVRTLLVSLNRRYGYPTGVIMQ
ncbi:hypothetical protein EAO71_20225 [Streptomyces sp. ms191]|nr:hypothetical protein EAO71_20225 [Streptomyces sp. ms191]